MGSRRARLQRTEERRDRYVDIDWIELEPDWPLGWQSDMAEGELRVAEVGLYKKGAAKGVLGGHRWHLHVPSQLLQ